MKRFILTPIFLMFCAAVVYGTTAIVLPPQQQSVAYQKYEKRPKNELSKLIYLMDRFKGTGFKVIYDQREYDSETSLQQAKNYIAKHYHSENASDWVREHAYRSASGQIIYLKASSGETEILRDALVNELKTLKI